jgi:hypothetical protein
MLPRPEPPNSCSTLISSSGFAWGRLADALRAVGLGLESHDLGARHFASYERVVAVVTTHVEAAPAARSESPEPAVQLALVEAEIGRRLAEKSSW